MKVFVYFLCLITFVACTGKQNHSALDTTSESDEALNNTIDSTREVDSLHVIAVNKAFKPYFFNKDYKIIDTGYYGCGTLEGMYAIVERDGKLADTIHLGVGIKAISKDYYFYLKITKCETGENVYPGTSNLRPDQYFMILNGRKVPLTMLVKDFDLYRSAPNVINGKVYFWQYSKRKDGKFDVKAAEYNPKSGLTKSKFLIADKLDGELHTSWPHEENGNIIFYWHDGVNWKFSPDFKLLNNVRHK